MRTSSIKFAVKFNISATVCKIYNLIRMSHPRCDNILWVISEINIILYISRDFERIQYVKLARKLVFLHVLNTGFEDNLVIHCALVSGYVKALDQYGVLLPERHTRRVHHHQMLSSVFEWANSRFFKHHPSARMWLSSLCIIRRSLSASRQRISYTFCPVASVSL
jgi:hypothetical protein